jgi:hypothetical protein
MDYFVTRGDQRFGPYSLTDLQRYVQSGNIAVNDMVRSEGMNESVPVSQVLGTIPVASIAPPGAIEVPITARLVDLPPNLHWGLLLLLEVVTRNLFNLIWALIQANWARKLINDNKPMVLVAMYPAGIIAGIFAMMNKSTRPLGGLFIIAGVIVYLVGIFSIKAAMEEYFNSTENIGLTLSGVMTFFFSTVYIQYHINRIARWKKTGVLS